MLLEKIILKNFRQFYGEQEIIISCDPDKNVTLIHAENGVGKTTLLNALLWCFYKDTTSRFESPDKIVSNQALEEDDYNTSVEIFFENDGEKYCVKRMLNEKYDDESFDAFQIQGGNYKKLDSPNVLVETVIPREMSKYFFFDGEYAETFSSRNNKQAVREAVENMLGCRNASQAQDDLNRIKKEVDKEIGILTKNSNSAGIQEEIEKLEEQTHRDEVNSIKNKEDLEFAQTMRKEISDSLRNTEGAREIQEKRDGLEGLKALAEEKKKQIEIQRVRWIDKLSIGLLSTKLTNTNLKIFENANIKGLIPSKIAETFVKDLIEDKNCICHRPFSQGSEEENAIKSLLKEAHTAIMNDRLMDIKSRMGMLKLAKSTALSEYKDVSQQLEVINSDIQGYENAIRECGSQLQGSEISEIAERENALEQRQRDIIDLSGKIGRLDQEIESRAVLIGKKKSQREKFMSHDQRAAGLQSKIKLLDATIRRLGEELNKYREYSRKNIIEKVNSILDKTARRDYTARIDEAFNLEMFHGKTAKPVAKSSGENQLLSLSFIASLVSFAAERRGEVSQLLKPGAMAPLMLDSPFGQLDPTYRKSTAEFLPALTGQVILLLSKTQGDEDVIDVLSKKIGAEYVLISENTAEKSDKPSDVINLHGEEIECSLYNCKKDLTKIKKVTLEINR